MTSGGGDPLGAMNEHAHVAGGSYTTSRGAPGSLHFMMLDPRPEPDYQPPSLVGTLEERGVAYLFRLPSDIHSQAGVIKPYSGTVGTHSVVIYPPFRAEPDPRPVIQQILPATIPYPPGTASPGTDSVTISGITTGSWLGEDTLFANALRIDVRPYADPNCADRLAKRLLAQVRWRTNQWWVGRGIDLTYSHLRNAFYTNELGERLSGIQVYFVVSAGLGLERHLTPDIFARACADAIAGREVPMSLITYYDALHFFSTGEARRSVLEVALACELARDETLERIAASDSSKKRQAKKLLKVADFRIQISSEMKKLIGRSFEAEHPPQFADIDQLWLTRHKVAHGKPLVIHSDGGLRDLTPDDYRRFFNAVPALLNWFARL